MLFVCGFPVRRFFKVYLSTTNLMVIQLRSDVFEKMEASFLMSLCKWIEELSFKNVIVVTSASKMALTMAVKWITIKQPNFYQYKTCFRSQYMLITPKSNSAAETTPQFPPNEHTAHDTFDFDTTNIFDGSLSSVFHMS